MPCTSDDYRLAMRRFPAGVAIVASGASPYRAGMTATAICSLSADPPQVLVCLNQRTMTMRTIELCRGFSINLLNTGQLPLARIFAGLEGEAAGEEKFTCGGWREGLSGAPVLADAVLTLECALVASHAVSTHNIVIGRVLDIPGRAAEDALLYCSGAFGKWADLAGPQHFN
ncbi:MAG: flavin reductase family protein [Parvibaculaceae bacterium]